MASWTGCVLTWRFCRGMLFGQSSERLRPGPATDADGHAGGDGEQRVGRAVGKGKRGPGGRAGRRDYPPFTLLRDHLSWEQRDW